MKRLLSILLASILLIFTCGMITGCSDFTEALDLAFENDCLREENDELKEEIESLKIELNTLKFNNKYPDGIINEGLVELTYVERYIGENAGDALTVLGTAQVTINGGVFDGGQTPFGGAGNTSVWVNSPDAKVIINDGYFYNKGLAVNEDGVKDTGHIDLIYCSAGIIEINGGWFEGADSDVWLINCKDSAYKDGIAQIIVKGGTFVNFDPSNCVSEGESTNFVPEGYAVVKETKDNVNYYTVVEVIETEELSEEEVIEL